VRLSALPHLATMFGAVALLASGTADVHAQDRSRQYAQSSKLPPAPPAPPQSKVELATTTFQFPVGSLVIVNNERRLYYITAPGQAVRYRVAVGKNEELWMGKTFIAAKVVDPKWIPVNGDDPVEGGDPANPLGKRALYLDWSLLRIHGTPARGSIGSATSNGCIRMLNEDVMDLFERVHFGAPVYAIRSWKEATLFGEVKVGEKIYHDPDAHREAQEDLQDQIRDRAAETKDKEAALRRERSRTSVADAGRTRTTSVADASRARGTAPFTSGYSAGRSALGRGQN
jgi:lipoprotein-anchoring transpeptidase ErfK/SrfK